VTEDQAGGTIQCPRCGRLNDIPLLDELPGLAEDGTIRMDDRADRPEVGRIAEASRTFSRRPVGAEEIDLRPTLDEVKRVGDVGPLEWEPPRVKPKYDPVTGELIRPLEVRRDAAMSVEGVPAGRRTSTHRTDEPTTAPGASQLLLELLRPLNLIVTFVVLAAFVFMQVLTYLGLTIVVDTLGLDVTPAILGIYAVFWLMVLAHYANVTDDVGREGRDELPRPLRDLRWHDDLWGPLWKSMLGLGICYWPIFVVAHWLGDRSYSFPLETVLFVGGSVALPAVWITLICDGLLANLRPDRVWGVIRACGGGYFVALIAGALALIGHAWGVLGLWLVPAGMLEEYPRLAAMNHYAIADSVLFVGIYFAHYYFWTLGILYRRHHNEFPWVMQRHTPRKDPRLHPQGGGGPPVAGDPLPPRQAKRP
jgi:hypothetical protein